MAGFISNAEGNFFVQENRDEEFEWLTCTGVGDIDVPVGDLTTITEPDPMSSGKFKVSGFIQGVAEAGSYTLTKPLARVSNWLVERNCPFGGRINWVCRGARTDPTNYEVAALMVKSQPGPSKRIINPVALEGGEEARVNTEMDVAFQWLLFVYQLTIRQDTVSNTNDAYDIYFLAEQCEDRCGPGHAKGEYGIIGLDGGAGYSYESEVKITTDGFVTIGETDADPFAYGGDVQALFAIETASGVKILAFRGSTVVGHPAEVGVSEDDGDSWTNYTIGAVNGQYVLGYGLNGANIFVACSGGYIYKSSDQGVTWTVVEAGVETTEDLNDIVFLDANLGYAVGNSNAFLITEDGGDTWSAGTGPAAGVNLLTVAANVHDDIFVGGNAGAIYVLQNNADDWETRVDHGSGTIPWIEFDPVAKYVGAYIWNTAAPVGYLYRSENEGATWTRVPGMLTNSGLNGGHIVDANHIYAVGNAHGGSTFIVHTQPTS